MMSAGVDAVTLLLVVCGQLAASAEQERFPSEDHKKYPLATVYNGHPGTARTKVFVPYQEPDFVKVFQAKWQHFKGLTFPLPRAKLDTFRYFGGVSHMYGVIPKGAEDVTGKRSRGVSKHVFDVGGRLKNVHSIDRFGVERLTCSLTYYDAPRIVVCGHAPGASWAVSILQYAATSGQWDLNGAPLRLARLSSEGRLIDYGIFQDGKVVKSVYPPRDLTVPPGKWPSQAARYYHAMDEIVKSTQEPDVERMEKILTYMDYRPLAEEDPSGYAGLKHHVIGCLAALRNPGSVAFLVECIEESDLRDSASRAITAKREPGLLGHLLRVLELEDKEAAKLRLLNRNRHLVTSHTARAMLNISRSRAREMLLKFIGSRERVYESTIKRRLAD